MSITENDAQIGALPDGTLLHRYLIDRIIGRGGFGITYRARNIDDEFVAVKEYLPRQLVFRQDEQVVPVSDSTRSAYHDGLGCFLKEAKALRRLATLDATGGGVVRVMNFFEGNGTAYLVMEYLAGQSLDALFKLHSQGLPDAQLNVLARRLLGAVACVHGAGFTHGDIKPANIMLRKDGRPVLIDFGAARWTSQGRTVTASEIVSERYAPIELFTGAEQGPFSDIYAIGSTLYDAIGGRTVDAVARHQALLGSLPDPQTPAVEIGAGRYDPKLLRMIDRASAVAPASRPQSVAALVALLDHGEPDLAPPAPAPLPVEPPAAVSPSPAPAVTTAPPEPVPSPRQAAAPAAPIPANDVAPRQSLPAKSRGFGAPLMAGAIIAGIVGAGVWFLRQPADQAPPAASTQVASDTAAPPAEMVPAAPVPVPKPPAPAAAKSTTPVVVEPPKPSVAAPVPPRVAEPTKPVAAEPTKPAVAETAQPPAAEPAKPSVAEPVKPAVAEAAKPPVPEPAKPAVAESAKPPAASPAKAAVPEPVKPVVAEAAKPPAPPPPKPPVPEPVKPVVAEAAQLPAPPPPKPPVPEPVKPVVAEAAVPPSPEAAKPKPVVAEAGKPPAAATTAGEPVKLAPVESPKPIVEPRARPPAEAVPQVATRGPQGPTEAAASAQALPDGPVGARVSGPALVYPQRLKKQERPGSADVVCLIGVDGKPSDCTLTDVSGPSPFGEAALAYVRGSTYRPARRGGVPVSEQLKVHVEFGLND